MATKIDPTKLRLQDSGALIESLQRVTNPDILNIAAILKDHRDNTNSLLRTAQETHQSLLSLTNVVNSISIPSPSTNPLTIIEAATFGSTLDDVTLNDAIASVTSPSASIHVKAGTWTINAPVNVNKSVILFGDGPGTLLIRMADLPAGTGMLDIASPGVSIQSLTIDGEVTAPAHLQYATPGPGGFQGVSPETGATGDYPMAPVLTLNTSIWVHGGSDNFSLYQATIQHTGGYAVLLDASQVTIRNPIINSCIFQSNSPFLFGFVPGSLNYGSWAGGIFACGGTYLAGAGTLSYVDSLTVNNNQFMGNSGNQVWSWLPQLSILHRNFSWTNNQFTDIGLDCLNTGGVQGFTVSGNSGYRIGYIAGHHAYLAGANAVFLDTSGLARSGKYVANTVLQINGSFIDSDGLMDSVVSGNTGTNVDPSDLLYTTDEVASFGPTRGINCNNTYDLRGQKGNNYCGNTFRGFSNISISLFNNRNTLVEGNTIYHPATATGVPVSIANSIYSGIVNVSGTGVSWVSGDKFDPQMIDAGYLFIYVHGVQYELSTIPSPTSAILTTSAGTQTGVAFVIGKVQNNTVTGNQIFYNAPNVCIYEDNSYGNVYGPNYIFGNRCVGQNYGEVLLSNAIGNTSATNVVVSSNDRPLGAITSTLLQRDSTATKFYKKSSTGVVTQKFQLADSGPTMNVSFGMTGVCNTAGTAVTRESGTGFTLFQPGANIFIRGKAYVISSITTDDSLVLRDSAGIQTGVSYFPLDGIVLTGPRSVAAVLDTVGTGHLYADGFLCLTDTTFCYTNDPGADIFDDTYGLLRYNSSLTRFEQSTSLSGGHRVWSPLGGGSSGVAGANTQVQYNASGVMGADAHLTWDYTNQVLHIAGVTATAGLDVSIGFVQSAEGFFTGSSSVTAVNVANGGVAAKWLVGTTSLTLAAETESNAGLSLSSQIRIICDSNHANKAYISEAGGAFIPLVGTGTPGGSVNQLQYNNGSGGFGASPYLTFDPDPSTGLLLTVIGRTGFAAISTMQGFIQSQEGFYTGSANSSAIGAPYGGIVGNILTSNSILQVLHSTAPAPPSAGTYRTYVDSSNILRYYDFGSSTWLPVGGSSVPGGTNTHVQFNDSSAFGGSANFTFDKTSQLLSITGTATHAAISAVAGFIQSAEGFYAPYSSFQTINVPNGGLYGRSLRANVYTQVGQNYGPPVPTSGDGIVDGCMYYDTAYAKIYAHVAGTWVPLSGVTSIKANGYLPAYGDITLIGGTGISITQFSTSITIANTSAGGAVSSVSGSGNIAVYPTTGACVVSISDAPSFLGAVTCQGILAGSNGIQCGGVNPYYGGVQYSGWGTGPAQVLNFPGGFTIGGYGSYHNLTYVGGNLVSVS